MKWMAIVVLIWVASPTSPPPVIQVAVETQALCDEVVKSLARDLGKTAAKALKSGGEPFPKGATILNSGKYNLVLTSCVQIAN